MPRFSAYVVLFITSKHVFGRLPKPHPYCPNLLPINRTHSPPSLYLKHVSASSRGTTGISVLHSFYFNIRPRHYCSNVECLLVSLHWWSYIVQPQDGRNASLRFSHLLRPRSSEACSAPLRGPWEDACWSDQNSRLIRESHAGRIQGYLLNKKGS